MIAAKSACRRGDRAAIGAGAVDGAGKLAVGYLAPRLDRLSSESAAFVAQRMEPGGDQQGRRQAGQIGEQRRGAPVLLVRAVGRVVIVHAVLIEPEAVCELDARRIGTAPVADRIDRHLQQQRQRRRTSPAPAW